MKIDLIAGARPNFVKIAALIDGISRSPTNITFRLIHTGQHYDNNLSNSFFEQLQIPKPDFNILAGSGSQAEQTGRIMLGYENILLTSKPDVTIVVGDVTSSMACAITARKMQVKVAHVEAGIRSHDWSMPEEVNRVIIDSISNFFFTTSENASTNLVKAGIKKEKVFFVGNTMIDTLLKFKDKFKKPKIWDDLGLTADKYLIITLHRPANVDQENNLKIILEEIISHSHNLPIIFPAHPRTAKILQNLNIEATNFHPIDPLGYLEFNYLVERSKAVITDSGGITEESTVLGIPCLTLRDNTERPETISIGTNELIGTDPRAIGPSLKKVLIGKWKSGNIPELWDGKTSERIINILPSLIR